MRYRAHISIFYLKIALPAMRQNSGQDSQQIALPVTRVILTTPATLITMKTVIHRIFVRHATHKMPGNLPYLPMKPLQSLVRPAIWFNIREPLIHRMLSYPSLLIARPVTKLTNGHPAVLSMMLKQPVF